MRLTKNGGTMDPLRQYDIVFVGLKIGVHDFSYTIDDKFFELFSDSLVKEAALGKLLAKGAITIRFLRRTGRQDRCRSSTKTTDRVECGQRGDDG
ncbi:MAG: hypothetical protein LH473_13705, partial [Chitinophagales bacterium]|nr:hypothetical protein [Chitinophagales bacterium]